MDAAFVGKAHLDTFATLQSGPVRVSSVAFENGAITHWHAHAGGQVLYVTSGRGRYCERGGPTRDLSPGDRIEVAAGVDHWHGAAEGADMHHLAISSGDTLWKEAPDPSE